MPSAKSDGENQKSHVPTPHATTALDARTPAAVHVEGDSNEETTYETVSMWWWES